MLGDMRSTTRALAIVAGLLLVPILGLLLLYAYRSQSPAVPTIPMSQAIDDINNARVDTIVVQDNAVTMKLTDGRQESTNTGGDPRPILQAAEDLNRRLPGRSILVYQDYSPMYGMPFLAIVFRFLPLIVLVALVLFAARVIAGSRANARYEQLARLADLRDRKALTEEEFQREKGRLMR